MDGGEGGGRDMERQSNADDVERKKESDGEDVTKQSDVPFHILSTFPQGG